MGWGRAPFLFSLLLSVYSHMRMVSRPHGSLEEGRGCSLRLSLLCKHEEGGESPPSRQMAQVPPGTASEKESDR